MPDRTVHNAAASRVPIPLRELVGAGRRHAVRTLTQPSHDLGKFRRQQVTFIHRDHLPELHRRAAQMCELVGDAGDIAGRQHHVAQPRTIAASEPARAFRDHPARNPARQSAE